MATVAIVNDDLHYDLVFTMVVIGTNLLTCNSESLIGAN